MRTASRIAIGTAIILAATAPTPAFACRNPSNLQPLFHRSVETVRNAEFVAEVEILDYAWEPRRVVISARILSVIRGAYSGNEIAMDIRVISSCDSNPRTGRRGLIAGSIREINDNGIVVDHIRGPSRRQLDVDGPTDD
jgi:hypothetical protein